jgi:endonuclease YncB( thermonuclease family)
MRGPYQILLPLLSLFLVRVDLTDLYPLRMKVEIIKVYDGDTVLVKRGSFEHKVRLSRIDAPEKGQPFLLKRGDAGALSRTCLSKLLKQSGVLEIYGTDIYGRILGDIDEVSFKLIEAGCVSLYPHAKFKDQKEKYAYLRALMKAKRLKRNLWAFGGIEQPKVWRSKNKHHFRKLI